MALPKGISPEGISFNLTYPALPDQGLIKAANTKADQWDRTYKAGAAGWLVVHQPYDVKWQIIVDGKAVRFYRANKSFIGFPVQQGEHQISIRYWPHTWIRWSMVLSVLVSTYRCYG